MKIWNTEKLYRIILPFLTNKKNISRKCPTGSKLKLRSYLETPKLTNTNKKDASITEEGTVNSKTSVNFFTRLKYATNFSPPAIVKRKIVMKDIPKAVVIGKIIQNVNGAKNVNTSMDDRKYTKVGILMATTL